MPSRSDVAAYAITHPRICLDCVHYRLGRLRTLLWSMYRAWYGLLDPAVLCPDFACHPGIVEAWQAARERERIARSEQS